MPCSSVKIITNRIISDNIYQMEVPFDGEIRPGQFFMLRTGNAATLLPRPISVCDHRDGVLTFLYQVVGRGTGELSAMQPGDSLTLTGPLGNGFPLEKLCGSIALVGGGIGVAPLLYTARQLRELGCKVASLVGYRDEIFLTEELETASDSLKIATETGIHGKRGYVTSLLKPEEYSAVLCCGPEPMMRAVTQLCQIAGTPVYVSMETKMACGVGGCLVCTCTDKNGRNHRACTEGPVFRGEEIDFDC